MAIISFHDAEGAQGPKVLNASRKKRIAAGSGTTVQDVNKLLKMHRQMADMMKKLGKGKGMLASLFGGGMPDPSQMTPEDLPPELAQGQHAQRPAFPASRSARPRRQDCPALATWRHAASFPCKKK